MPVMNWVVMNGVEAANAQGYNTAYAQIAPIEVNHPSPGVGINLNPSAADYEPGEPVSLDGGKWLAPKRIVDDPDYPSAMKAYLATLPWAILDSESVIILPPDS
jgi:hypothetical protein